MMGAILRIDKAGRIALSKPARDKLQFMAGDELTLESSDDAITLRPVRGTAQLRKKRCVWVFRCGEPLSAEVVQETLALVRREDEG